MKRSGVSSGVCGSAAVPWSAGSGLWGAAAATTASSSAGTPSAVTSWRAIPFPNDSYGAPPRDALAVALWGLDLVDDGADPGRGCTVPSDRSNFRATVPLLPDYTNSP